MSELVAQSVACTEIKDEGVADSKSESTLNILEESLSLDFADLWFFVAYDLQLKAELFFAAKENARCWWRRKRE